MIYDYEIYTVRLYAFVKTYSMAWPMKGLSPMSEKNIVWKLKLKYATF